MNSFIGHSICSKYHNKICDLLLTRLLQSSVCVIFHVLYVIYTYIYMCRHMCVCIYVCVCYIGIHTWGDYREIIQRLGRLAALAKETYLIPSFHFKYFITTCNWCYRRPSSTPSLISIKANHSHDAYIYNICNYTKCVYKYTYMQKDTL